jgi:Ca2+-binding EF-hand superfamily protein
MAMTARHSLIAAAVLLAAVAAIAAESPPVSKPVDTAQAMRDRMDRNVDGKISFEEYRNAMVRRFGARDLNDDGVLEGDEFPKEWVAGADVQEATGKVSFEQFTAELPLVFAGFDADKDGQLDATETAAFASARKTREESRS